MFSPAHYHPMMVHFPIALLFVAFLSDAAGLIIKKDHCLHKAAFILQILGTMGVIAAFITGDEFTAWESFAGVTKDAFELHQDAAVITLWVAIVASIFRINIVISEKFIGVLKWICILLLGACAVSVLRTGFLGGDLVLNFLMGI